MHEFSLVQALIERVEAEAAARQASAVHSLTLRIGELSAVEPELLATAFEAYRADTVCREAGLEIERVPARWVCRSCGRPLEKGGVLRCGDCGAPGRLESGDEIVLARIEMEVA
jgi:hydrogenase nickel incorporation protein HypA/HybF